MQSYRRLLKKQVVSHPKVPIMFISDFDKPKKNLDEGTLHTKYKRNRFKSLERRRSEEEKLLSKAMNYIKHDDRYIDEDGIEYEVKNPRTYNDDDFYAFDPDTKVIKSSWSHKSVGRRHSEHVAQQQGWQVVSGMRAKSLELLTRKRPEMEEAYDTSEGNREYFDNVQEWAHAVQDFGADVIKARGVYVAHGWEGECGEFDPQTGEGWLVSKAHRMNEDSGQRVKIVSGLDMYIGKTGTLGKMQPHYAKEHPGHVLINLDHGAGSVILPKSAVKIQGVAESHDAPLKQHKYSYSGDKTSAGSRNYSNDAGDSYDLHAGGSWEHKKSGAKGKDSESLRKHIQSKDVAEGLNEFAPDGFNGGDDGEEFNPGLAKMAYEAGIVKGASLADGATLERAMAIDHWDSHDGGMYKQYFAKGFKQGRMNKIKHDNKQYNLNLKLMKDGSIRHGEQGVAEGTEERKENRLKAMITDYEQRAQATKNDIKRDHYMKMAKELRGKLKTSDEEVDEGAGSMTVGMKSNHSAFKESIDEAVERAAQSLAEDGYEFSESLRTENPCWKGYHPVGTKKKNGRTVPNCVPKVSEGGPKGYDSQGNPLGGGYDEYHGPAKWTVAIDGKSWKSFDDEKEAYRVAAAIERKHGKRTRVHKEY